MFELTVNWESNCLKNNGYKMDKYAHFLTDITTYIPSITAFDVGVRGHISNDNMKRWHELQKIVKKTIKLETFTNNLSSLAVNSSFFIYTCRKNPVWSQKSTMAHHSNQSCLPLTTYM